MEIKTSDLWIYNFDRFNYWFSKRPLNIKLPFSIFHARRAKKATNSQISSEAFLVSLLFYLYTQRGEYDISVCKSSAVRQVLANGSNLIEIKFNDKPFIYSAYLCGVYEFNSTVAVKLGFKKDGLIKVSKKIFTKLFVAGDFYTQNYGFVDLISCPPVGFDNKFLDFELVVPEIPKYDFTGIKRKNIIIPDCVVFVKRSKILKYAFSDIIDLGVVNAEFKTLKYSKKKFRRYLNVIKRVKKPYVFKFVLLFSRLLLSVLYFNKAPRIINSNLHLYKIHIIFKRFSSFFQIFKRFVKNKYFYVHKAKWYRRFKKLFTKVSDKFKLTLSFSLRKPERRIVTYNRNNSAPLKFINPGSFFAKEMVSFSFGKYSQLNNNFFNLLFGRGKYLVTKYSVHRLSDYYFTHYIKRKRIAPPRRIKLKLKKRVLINLRKLQKQQKLKQQKLKQQKLKQQKLKQQKLKQQKLKQQKYLSPRIINFNYPLNRSNIYKRILSYYSLFRFKSKHNLMSQGNVENLGFFRVQRKLKVIIPRRHYKKYRVMVSNFLQNYSRILKSLFLRNLNGNISALYKNPAFNGLESAKIVRRLLKANKRRLNYMFCFKHYKGLEKKKNAKIRALLKLRRQMRAGNYLR